MSRSVLSKIPLFLFAVLCALLSFAGVALAAGAAEPDDGTLVDLARPIVDYVLSGHYLFTDYCGATLWASKRGADGKVATTEIGKLPDGVTAFGEDEAGELYFTVDGEGAVYRFVAR